MKPFQFALLLGVALSQFCNPAIGKVDLDRFSFREPQMGTLMEILLYADNESEAEEAATAAFKRISELNSILSDYDSESELMRLLQKPTGDPVLVSEDLFTVFERAESLSLRTAGAFDVTVGPLSRLWREARREKELPDATAISEARARVGYRLVQLDREEMTVTLLQPRMQIDFGGIAKGYAADEALRILKERGFRQALVAAAGDIAAGEAPPDEEGWRIGIESLDRSRSRISQVITLQNCAVSTSGDTEQFVEINGVRYSHILDPATGLGLTERISVTVLAPDATRSDSIATAVSVLGAEKGLAFVESLPGVEVRIIAVCNDEIRIFRSEGFPP